MTAGNVYPEEPKNVNREAILNTAPMILNRRSPHGNLDLALPRIIPVGAAPKAQFVAVLSIPRRMAVFGIITTALFFCFLVVLPAQADSVSTDLFGQANQEYTNGNYEAAAELYESVIEKGALSPEVYYNLGNTYARMKIPGRAILNYERAHRLRPRDREVTNNLDHVRGLLEYQIEDRRNPYLKTAKQFLEPVGMSEMMLLVNLIFSLWILAFMSSLIFRSLKWLRRVSTYLLFLCVLVVLPVSAKRVLAGRNEAIVIAREAEVKYGPSFQDKTAFRLREGLTVDIQNVRDDWVHAHLRDGTSGWILRETVELITNTS